MERKRPANRARNSATLFEFAVAHAKWAAARRPRANQCVRAASRCSVHPPLSSMLKSCPEGTPRPDPKLRGCFIPQDEEHPTACLIVCCYLMIARVWMALRCPSNPILLAFHPPPSVPPLPPLHALPGFPRAAPSTHGSPHDLPTRPSPGPKQSRLLSTSIHRPHCHRLPAHTTPAPATGLAAAGASAHYICRCGSESLWWRGGGSRGGGDTGPGALGAEARGGTGDRVHLRQVCATEGQGEGRERHRTGAEKGGGQAPSMRVGVATLSKRVPRNTSKKSHPLSSPSSPLPRTRQVRGHVCRAAIARDAHVRLGPTKQRAPLANSLRRPPRHSRPRTQLGRRRHSPLFFLLRSAPRWLVRATAGVHACLSHFLRMIHWETAS